MDYAKVALLSLFIFYIDLSQPYDRVVREVVSGWPRPIPGATEATTDSARIQYLESISVSEHAAQQIVSNIRLNGTTFDRWNVSPVVRELVRGVHSKAWLRVGGRESVVATSTGGRQGCKLGGLIFAVDYDEALKLMRSEMAAVSISVRCKMDRNRPFWESACSSTQSTHDDVAEATLVDDDAAGIAASSPVCLTKPLAPSDLLPAMRSTHFDLRIG